MKKVKLCFDAGHYTNYNRSNIYKDYCEGNMVWTLHILVKEYLEANYLNVEIVMTRNNRDRDLSLYNRGYKSKGCDGFYSFHSNACNDKSINRVVIIKGFGEVEFNDYAKKIGNVIKKCMNINQETEVYEKCQNNRDEYYGVLRGAKLAGVKNRYILEHSFHTNYDAAKWLYNEVNLKKLAIEEAKVIAEHHGIVKKSEDSDLNTSWKNGTYNVLVKVTSNLNLRSGRGSNFPIVTTIEKGTVLKLGYIYENWGSTWDFKGRVLYFSCKYISELNN